MASLVLGIAGAAALGPAGLAWGGALGMSGAQIGFIAGSSLGSMLFAPNMPDVQGPRMGDLKVQASTYGTPIPIYYGTSRGAGQVIWSSDLIETAHEEEAGGKGGPSQSVTTYTYSVNCAIGICEGEISGIRRIWANGNLIFDISAGNNGATGQSDNIRIYTGSETQTPDALIEAYEGAGNVPAHRGIAYVVFENLQLEKYGNRIPNFSFEVVSNGDVVVPSHNVISDNNVAILHMIPHPLIQGLYLYTSRDDGISAPNIYLHVIDPVAGNDIAIPIDVDNASWVSGYITYVDFGIDPLTGQPSALSEIWVNTVRDDYIANNEVAVAFDVMSLSLKRRIVPETNIGINYAGKSVFDKSNFKVLFATSDSTISAGCRYLDPYQLTFDAGFSVPNVTNWFTGYSTQGKGSCCLVSYDQKAVFFIDGVASVQPTGVPPPDFPHITYDSKRNRYACFSRNVSSFGVFRVWNDDYTFAMQDITTTNTAMSANCTLTYWPIADKYLYRSNGDVRILNADTFKEEKTFSKSISNQQNIDNFEIPMLPEYFIGFVTNSPTSDLALIPITDRLDLNSVQLSSVVSDICNRVGLASGDIDVSGLSDVVEGYTIAQQMSARSAIDGLQAAYFFDAVESD